MNLLAQVGLAGLFIVATGFASQCLNARLAATVAALGAVLGGAWGAFAAARALGMSAPMELALPWAMPGGEFVVGLDPLSAFFLLPVFVVGAVCAAFGRSYLGARPWSAAGFNLFIGSMVLVLLARHGFLFLLAWEVMTLAAYGLIARAHHDAEVRRAGWAYLIASHVSVVALLLCFALLGAFLGEHGHNSLAFSDWAILKSSIGASAALGWGGMSTIFGLALVGFGIKAGALGLHVWLPEAHAAAPSHVSAVMSAVLIKLGLYGLLRLYVLLPAPPWFGAVLSLFGVLGALIGIALSLQQRDIKRTLAYSSVENMGIIWLALGLGFMFRAHGLDAAAGVVLAGALLHVWNHAAMKGLMFLGAGSVVHAAGTKDIERLGGLLGKMPVTGLALIVGAVAIAGLPPLNGFASEWLVFVGLSRVAREGTGAVSLLAMTAAALLAMAGGLALLGFVRLVGMALLGLPRHERTALAQESSVGMTLPLSVMTMLCCAAAVFSPRLVSRLDSVVGALSGAGGPAAPAAVAHDGAVRQAAELLSPVSQVSMALLLVVGAAILGLRQWTRAAPRTETWSCGYTAATPRMQYTASSFSEFLSTRVLPRWLQPLRWTERPEGLLPSRAQMISRESDPVTRKTYEPLLRQIADRLGLLRFFHQGRLQMYLLYMLVAVVLGFGWISVRDDAGRNTAPLKPARFQPAPPKPEARPPAAEGR
ncbi:MAG: oxidoreductase [Deltaproteobacteria bacterium]|nr:oxidoreductase [Deltaproteobacteria bacterium]